MKTKYRSYIPKYIMIDEFEKSGIFKDLTSKVPNAALKCIAYAVIDLLPCDPQYIINSIGRRAVDYDISRIQILRTIHKYNLEKYVVRPKKNGKRQYFQYHWNIQAFNITNLIIYFRAQSAFIQDKMLSSTFADIITYELDNMSDPTNRAFAGHFIRRYKYLSIDESVNRNFHMRKNGDITFLPGGKTSLISDNDKWLHENRQKIKLGKALKYLLGNTLKDSQIEYINNKIKSRYTFTDTISVVNGKEILKYYHYTSYGTNIGTLYDSCMKHEKCQEWLQIYADNPEEVSLVISLNNEGKLTGRALLWHNVNKPDHDGTETFMDRIYGTEITQEAFKKYAKEKGYWHKQQQTYANNVFVNSIGQTTNQGWVMLANNNDLYPYFDSFKYTDDWSASHVALDLEAGEFKLDSINGGPSVDSEYYDDDDDYVYDRNDDRQHRDDVHYDSFNDEYIYCDDAEYCEVDDTYCYYSNAIELANGGYAHPDGENYCYSHYDGLHYLPENCFYSDYDGDYYCNSVQATCYLNGPIHEDNLKTIDIDGTTYEVHENVTREELLNNL